MKVAIIDDEQNCRLVLRDKIVKFDSNIDIIGEASGVEAGINLIISQNPDVVFLDIQMNDGTGFDLLNRLEKRDFLLVFTTAYDHYAIKAFKYSAIHYLLKPVDFNELSEAINRLRTEYFPEDTTEDLLDSYEKGEFETLCLRTEDNLHKIQLCDIEWIKAEGSYCTFNLKPNEKIMISKPLKEYVELLPEELFIRPHKSFLININSVESYLYKSLELKLRCGESIPVSRRNKQMILESVLALDSIRLLKTS